MKIELGRRGQVRCSATIALPLAAITVWGQLRDFHHYASLDYFHDDLRVEGRVPRQGARLSLRHRVGPFSIARHGRILWWREGYGYAFSDLSGRGCHHGFPHVLILRVAPVPMATGEDAASSLEVCVRGRWTAAWLPRWARRLWLAWVFGYIVTRTRNDLLTFHLQRGRPARASDPPDAAAPSHPASIH